MDFKAPRFGGVKTSIAGFDTYLCYLVRAQYTVIVVRASRGWDCEDRRGDSMR